MAKKKKKSRKKQLKPWKQLVLDFLEGIDMRLENIAHLIASSKSKPRGRPKTGGSSKA